MIVIHFALEWGLERLMKSEQGCASVENYVSALVSLWKEQTSMMLNSSPHPRSAHVRVLSDALKKMGEKKRKRAYVDKGLSCIRLFALTCAHLLLRNDLRWVQVA